MDAWGHATQVTEANGVTLTRGYDPATGLMTSLAASGPNGTIAQYQYSWDGFGNLTTRTDSTHTDQEISEHETYDKLNRLIRSVLSGGAGTTQSFHYDDTGNLTYRSDRGTYTYGAGSAGPHAVTDVAGTPYTYNANGEMMSGAGRSYTWSVFGKAKTITKPGKFSTTTVSFDYGPGGTRTQKTVTGATSETVIYLGGAERLTVNGQTSIRRTLALADLTIIDTGGANAKLLFPITDHLGSTVVIGSDAGASAQAMRYGPFGRRMTAGWAGYMNLTQALSINENYTDKGYTGQEGLDAVGLWNYNARLYDPKLGRFLSVDPLIAHPGSTQAINPYSYVENNPLNKTDPTGEASAASAGTGIPMCAAKAYCSSGSGVTIEGNGGSQSIGAGGQRQKKSNKDLGTSTGTQNPNVQNGTEDGTHGKITGQDKGGDSTSEAKDKANKILDDAKKHDGYVVPNKRFKTLDEARKAAANAWGKLGIETNREANWWVVKYKNGSYGYTYPGVGNGADKSTGKPSEALVGLVDPAAVAKANNVEPIEWGHNHLRGDDNFSGADQKIYLEHQVFRKYDGWMWDSHGHAHKISYGMVHGTTGSTTFLGQRVPDDDIEVSH